MRNFFINSIASNFTNYVLNIMRLLHTNKRNAILKTTALILAALFVLNTFASVYAEDGQVEATASSTVQTVGTTETTVDSALPADSVPAANTNQNDPTASQSSETAIQSNETAQTPAVSSDTAVEQTPAVQEQTVDKQTQKEELLSIEDNSYIYRDIENYWAKDEMTQLSYMDILKGFDDKTMKPENNITREEYIAMLVRAIGLPTSGTFVQNYKDVPKTKWSFKYIAAANKAGLLQIFNTSYLYPQKAITREEMAVIAAKVLSSLPTSTSTVSFKDISSSYKYKASIDKVASLGIINGMPDGSFMPKNKATRAAAAAIIKRLLNVGSAASSESILKATAINYEKSVYNSPNIGNYTFSTPSGNSVGKENRQNSLRASTIRYLNSKGINSRRYVSDAKAVVDKATLYLAEATVTYNVVVEGDNFSANKYSVSKKVYLKKYENKWVVYNSSPEFKFVASIDRTKKVNLAWQNIGSTTPNMSGKAKIEGLNVISPTWFVLTDGNGSIKSTATTQYVEWAHSNGYKVWPLFGNEFNAAYTNSILSSSVKRAKVIDSMISYANQYKFDGINVDFENMYTKDKDNFTLFMKELSTKAKANNLTVSVDVTVIAKNSNWSECYDRAALASIVDYVALMAYDQHWTGSQESGSVAQVTWVEDNLKKVLNEVPAHKLILGMPFYTRIWKEDYSGGKTIPVVTSTAVSMADAEKAIAANNAAKLWDSASGQYYSEYTVGNAVYKIWLEDEKSIEAKAKLVSKYNVSGAAAWRLGYETQGVWTVIAKTIGSGNLT